MSSSRGFVQTGRWIGSEQGNVCDEAAALRFFGCSAKDFVANFGDVFVGARCWPTGRARIFPQSLNQIHIRALGRIDDENNASWNAPFQFRHEGRLISKECQEIALIFQSLAYALPELGGSSDNINSGCSIRAVSERS